MAERWHRFVVMLAIVLAIGVTPVWAGEAEARQATHPVAGMIGQVNGRSIYAHRALAPMDEELEVLGQRFSREAFRQRAQPELHRRLAEIVQNALVLAEAERDLSERERQGLKVVMQRMREEKIRRYGRGSRAVADRVLRERTGLGLEQTLEDRRQRLLVDRYMQKMVWPRVNVAYRDVERYYRDHYDQFNPPPTRTLRLIRAGMREAEQIEQRLAAGESFEQIASDGEVNAYRPREGGLMADAPGDEVFGDEAVNEAMRQLDAGEHAGPIEVGQERWFIKVERIDRPEQRSLKDAQREIEQRLRMQQLNRLSEQYYQQLLERGSFTPLEHMAERLVEIAVNRYATPDARGVDG